MRILLLEDNKAIRDMLKLALVREQHQTLEAVNVAEAKQQLLENEPDMLIVDWMLPDSSGIEYIHWVRRQQAFATIPILMLTAKNQPNDTIQALDAGADDYLSKPVAIAELQARVRALGRRPKTFVSDAHKIEFGPLKVDTAQHLVFAGGQEIEIKKTEYKLLCFFIKNPNRVWSRAQILDHVWGTTAYLDERTVDVHILRLRKQLKPHALAHMVTTVRGAGYKLSE